MEFLLQNFSLLMMKNDNVNVMLYRFRQALRNKLQEVMSHFEPEEEDEDMFTYLWSLQAAHIHLTPDFPSHKKSRVKAIELQNLSSLSWLRGDPHHAMRLYNQAVANAPSPDQCVSEGGARVQISKPDQTLADCYAGRSGVFFSLGFFDHCLRDVKRAVQAGYSRKAELEKWKKKCLNAIGRETDLPYVKEATRRFRGRPRKETFHERFKLYQQSQLGGYSLSESFRKSLLSEAEIPKLKLSDPHPTIPTMSNAVTLAYTPAKGRHILAARDIYPGELLFLEKNFCSCLDKESYETRCLTCAAQCCSSLPCPNCNFVMFCSEECREQGIAHFHEQECEVLPALAAFSDEMATLVFRLLMKLTFPRLKELLPILRQEETTLPPEKRGFNEEGLYDAGDFRAIYHLCTNKHHLSSLMSLRMCTVAFIITKILIACNKYFVDRHGNPLSPNDEDIALVGGTLVRILMVVSTNSFAFKELQVSLCRNSDFLKTSVGAKLCSTLSFLNHSCNPSVYSSTGSGISASRAFRFIPAGQEVTTCYGIPFYDLEKSGRWERLKGYYFTCCCEACENNWPEKSELPSKPMMKCLGCSEPVSCRSGKCTKCDKDEVGPGSNLTAKNQEIGKQILDAVKKYLHVRNSERFMDRNDEKDIEVISQVIEIMDKYMVLPCKLYYDAQEALQVYYNREGKFTYVSPGLENKLSNYYWPPSP
ncbi:SET and MYND domain-containing protein 4-like [Penaeus chinensis]|uniref:SET and MYND domain-containing protein 4-like n=1 Tax=Penaeus chinensis TaxID=139456 RepID=UPI001FB699D7|nr:SET and MYND domain-containing protein 4-like [Penaeus chinensis]